MDKSLEDKSSLMVYCWMLRCQYLCADIGAFLIRTQMKPMPNCRANMPTTLKFRAKAVDYSQKSSNFAIVKSKN